MTSLTTTTTEADPSTKSQWTFCDKAAFWKENKTIVKIVKIIVSPILLPLALMSDIINKTVNYAWSFKDVKVYEPNSPKIVWKKFFQNGTTTVVTFWKNHKKAIISAGVAIGLASVGFHYLLPYVKSLVCRNICFTDVRICDKEQGGKLVNCRDLNLDYFDVQVI